MRSCYVSGLITYPVKSLQGISKEAYRVDDFGFEHDRRFMLIDDKNKFISQRSQPKLALLAVNVYLSSQGGLESIDIFSDQLGHLSFPMSLFNEHIAQDCDVMVWGDVVRSLVLNDSYTEKLSKFLGVNVRLAFMSDSSFRQIDRQYFSEDKRVSFADGYPFLLTSEVSLADLNSRLEQPVPMSNFRPNIVISGRVSAYTEDAWKRIMIGDISFELVKPCSRCIMTTINKKGEKAASREPLKTLSQYRRNEFGVCFGQNLVHLSRGTIRVGDLVSFE